MAKAKNVHELTGYMLVKVTQEMTTMAPDPGTPSTLSVVMGDQVVEVIPMVKEAGDIIWENDGDLPPAKAGYGWVHGQPGVRHTPRDYSSPPPPTAGGASISIDPGQIQVQQELREEHERAVYEAARRRMGSQS